MENGVCPECNRKNSRGVYSSQYYPQEAPEQDGGQTMDNGGYQSASEPLPGRQDSGYVQPGQSFGQPGSCQGQGFEQPGSYQGQSFEQPGSYQGQSFEQPGSYQGQNYEQQSPYQNQGYAQPGQSCGQSSYQNQGYVQPGQNYGQPNYQGYVQPGQSCGQGYVQPGQNYGQPNYQGYMQPGPNYGQPNYQGQYDPYMKPKKEYRVWTIVGIVAGILVLAATVIGSYFCGYFLMKYASTEVGATDWYAGEYDSGEYEDGNGPEAYVPYDRDGASGEEETYTPSADDKYYYGPCDAINENVDYSFVTKSYTNEDPDNDIDVVINYFALKGDGIPNIDQLNEALETVALYYAVDFPRYSYYAEYGESYAVYTTTYVTYNDADMISLVMDEYVIVDDEYHVDLYPINIDVKNGVVLDNGSLLRIDSAFAEEFRKRNNEQNGSIDYLDSLSDEELAEVLRDKDSVIAYYTPLGMEVGLNYSGGGASGWVTVTYKDYEKYLMKF